MCVCVLFERLWEEMCIIYECVCVCRYLMSGCGERSVCVCVRVRVCVMHKGREDICRRVIQRTYIIILSLSLFPHHKHNTGASVQTPEAIFLPNDHTHWHTVEMNGQMYTHTHTQTHTHRVTELMVCVREQHLRWSSSSLDGGMEKTTHSSSSSSLVFLLLLLLLSSLFSHTTC